jgi:hypothetical protein
MGTRVKPGDQQEKQPLRSPAAYPLSNFKRVRIVRRADGYFCQFCIAVCRMQAHEDTGVERGIDVGLHAYYTDSEGQQVEHPRFFRKAERKVAQLQRQVSRPERAAQADQEAESRTQAQSASQRAARCSATAHTIRTLAYAAQVQADHVPEPAAQAAEPAGDQPHYPAFSGKAVTPLPPGTEAVGASASERAEAA